MRAIDVARDYFSHAWRGAGRAELLFTLAALLCSAALALVPTGYERDHGYSVRARVAVLDTDNDAVRNYGVIMQGEQIARVRVLGGPHRGLEREANNILYGKADLDKLYRPGDVALAVLDRDGSGGVVALTLVDHWRVPLQAGLVGAFLLLLVLFGGWTGVKSFASFIFTGAVIWKLLIPAFLRGVDPVAASLGVVALLTFVIVYLVAGFTRAGTAAFLGSMAGTVASALVALALAGPYRLNGAVRPFSETLRYGGFDHLNLGSVFLAGTFLASSGAFMDLAMDVAASLEEVHRKRPGLGFAELALSGLSVGRKVIGTMSTTLLLAYTGGFTSLLMVFMAQGVPAENMLTMSYVSSEIFHTMMGSLGLVLIAPFTAVLAAWLYSREPSAET